MKEESDPEYKRLLLKLSGEVLAGSKRYGLDSSVIDRYSKILVSLSNSGRQIGVVVGAGVVGTGGGIVGIKFLNKQVYGLILSKSFMVT